MITIILSALAGAAGMGAAVRFSARVQGLVVGTAKAGGPPPTLK